MALEVRRGRRGRKRLISTAAVTSMCPVLGILYVEKRRSVASRAAAVAVPASRVCWRGGTRVACAGGVAAKRGAPRLAAAARASLPATRRGARAVKRAAVVALERAVLFTYKLQSSCARASLAANHALVARRRHPSLAPPAERLAADEPRETVPELTGTPGYWR